MKQSTLAPGRLMGRHGRRHYIGLLYIAPWVVGFCWLQLYPFIASFVYSFTDYNMLKEPRFVGFNNYAYLFTKDPDFYKALLVTLLYAVVAVPAKLGFALLVAMLLNQRIRGINFYRTAYYIPSILGGSVAVAVVWKALFLKTGMINQLLESAGLQSVDWLGQPVTAIMVMVLLTVWQFGSSMIIFLAGLKGIPGELYEAAKVDGASGVKSFFKVTLPMLSPVIFYNLIMQSINLLQEFSAPFLITQGGPMKFTYLYGYKLYEEGFKYFKMGYASALSWVLFVIILLLTLLAFRSSQSWVHYEDGGR